MVSVVVKTFLYRLVLPACLLSAAIIRPSVTCLALGLLAVLNPFLPGITTILGTRPVTKVYLLLSALLSSLLVVLQIAFQIYEVSTRSADQYRQKCNSSTLLTAFVEFGYTRVNIGEPIGDSIRLLLPEVLCVVGCWAAYVVCAVLPVTTELTSEVDDEDEDETVIDSPEASASNTVANTAASNRRAANFWMLIKRLSDAIALVLLVAAAGIRPSLLSLPYFLTFLLLFTWWAVYVPLKRHVFNKIKLFLAFYTILHLGVLYLYQLHSAQSWLQPQSFLARLIGLTGLIDHRNDCPDIWAIRFRWDSSTSKRPWFYDWTAFAQPILLLVFYFYLVAQYRFTRSGVSNLRNETDVINDGGSSVHEEFQLAGRSPSASASTAMNPPHVSVKNGKKPQNNEKQLLDGGQDDEEDVFGTQGGGGGSLNSVQQMDRQRFTRLFSQGGQSIGDHFGKGVANILAFLIYHCYAFALLAMMTWALLFHCWLSFVWLLSACLIWIAPQTRKVSLRVSPVMVAYAEILLCLQFVCSMDIVDELQLEKITWLQTVGFYYDPLAVACIPMYIKMSLTLPFFVTLRLHRREMTFDIASSRQRSASARYGTFHPETDEQQQKPSLIGRMVGIKDHQGWEEWLMDFLGKYFIFVVAGVLLFISIRQPVFLYTVGYMVFFGALITLLQISFPVLRTALFFYWTAVVAYSSMVLVVVYLYQFHGADEWWANTTGISTAWNADIGLRKYSSGSLFVPLISPISFLVVTILQLKFFHSTWKRVTGLERARTLAALNQQPTETTADTSADDAVAADDAGSIHEHTADELTYWFNFKVVLYELTELALRVIEIHSLKIVAFTLMMVAVDDGDVTAVNLVLVVIVACMVPFRYMHMGFSIIASFYIVVIAIGRQLFQLNFATNATEPIPVDIAKCRSEMGNESWQYTSTSAWAGFKFSTQISGYLQNYVLALLVLGGQAVLLYRQRYKRVERGEGEPVPGIVYPEADRSFADGGLVDAAKYLINYFFYKFGVEMCLIMTVTVAAVRMDAVAVVYLLWLFVWLLLPRAALARLWWFYVLFLAILLPLQYALAVGLPPALCIDYPWHLRDDVNANSNFIMWLYLPSYLADRSPNAKFLIADFFQLLLASCQLYVFRMEHRHADTDDYAGGSNKPIYDSHYQLKDENNPVPDFVSKKSENSEDQNLTDFVKAAIFMYGHWITLIMVFVAGLGGTSLFALGYIISAFVFLWKGNDLYLTHISKVIQRWKWLALYNAFAILCKVTLQLIGCVYVRSLLNGGNDYCWLLQLFSIVCVNGRHKKVGHDYEKACVVRPEETRVGYDLLCFAFVLMQLRVIQSWYFQWVITEYRTERVLASRGAVLVNQLIKKEMKEQEESQQWKFERIRVRTAAIRNRYEEQLAKSAATEHPTPVTYGHGKDEAEGPPPIVREPLNYAEAKRAGDYYMFAYEPGEDERLDAFPESFAPEPTPGAEEQRGLGPAQLVHTAVQKDLDLDNVVSSAERAKSIPKGQRAAYAVSSQEEQAAIEEEFVPPPFADEGDEEKPTDGGGIVGKIKSILMFVLKLLASCLDVLAAFFNRRSRDHRYVSHVLSEERLKLRQSMGHELVRPSMSIREMRKQLVEGDIGDQVRIVKCQDDIEKMETQIQREWKDRNVVARFLTSLGFVLVSHTELIAYLCVVIDHMQTGSLISLPLPLLTFFWGTLCSPRPPKMFWIVLIAYTEAVVVIKFLFQFQFFNWVEQTNTNVEPFWPPRLLGIDKRPYYALWDIVLLIALFFHRYMLRKLGLWKDALQTASLAKQARSDEPTNTSDFGEVTSSVDSDAEKTRKKAAKKAQKAAAAVDGPTTSKDSGGGEVSKAAPFLAYCGGPVRFYQRLLNPNFRYIRDMYPFMFLMDVICFLILTFGYSSFGEGGSGDVVTDIQSNRVPLLFVAMLIAISFLIVIDRALYLRKAIICKLLFQYVLIILVHVWIFYAVPAITGRVIQGNITAKFWYLMKCIYFLFSAWQIRNGFAQTSIGNLLTRSYSIVNMVLFKVFMIAPFVFELRTVIDWTWTNTAMPLFDYFNMENFYATVYDLKCMRKFEDDFPAPRGQPKGAAVKYGMGVPLTIGIILIVWAPLLAFALLNQIGQTLPPERVRFSIEIEGYPPLYSMEVQGQKLTALDKSQFSALQKLFSSNRDAKAFMRDYDTASSVIRTSFRVASTVSWPISQPSKGALLDVLADNKVNLRMKINYEFQRERAKNAKAEPIVHSSSTSVDLGRVGSDIRKDLINALKNPGSHSVAVPKAFPPYVILPNEGKVVPAYKMLKGALAMADQATLPERDAYESFKLRLETADTNNGSTSTYWEAEMTTGGATDKYIFTDGNTTYHEMQMIAFVDKVFPGWLSGIVGGGIIAMYAAVVLVVSRLLRGLIIKPPLSVIIAEMPCVDRLLKICYDIYLVRESGDFALEEDLFARLIFLFRSPETLIKWTRPIKQKQQ